MAALVFIRVYLTRLFLSRTRWTSCLGRGRLRRSCWGRIRGRSTELWGNWTESGRNWSSRRRRSSLTSRKWPNRDKWWDEVKILLVFYDKRDVWDPNCGVCVYVALILAGCRQDHGHGFGSHAALREEVHHDEGQHSGRQPKDTDAQVQQQHGAGHEGRHQSHGDHEQTGLRNATVWWNLKSQTFPKLTIFTF